MLSEWATCRSSAIARRFPESIATGRAARDGLLQSPKGFTPTIASPQIAKVSEDRSGGGPSSLALTAAATGRSARPLRSCKLLSDAAPLRPATFLRSVFPNTRLVVTPGSPASFAAGGPAVHLAKPTKSSIAQPAISPEATSNKSAGVTDETEGASSNNAPSLTYRRPNQR